MGWRVQRGASNPQTDRWIVRYEVVLATQGAGNAGSTQKRAAYAAPTGVRFPRTSLTCHSEDLREGGCWECRVHPRDRRLAPRQPGFLSSRTSIVRTAHHRHPPVPAPHVSRHASLRPAALLTRGGRPAPAAQTCLAHRPGLNPCCTHPAGRVACPPRPSTPPALARLRWTPVPPARAAGPPPHASASTPTASPDGSSPSRDSRLLVGFLGSLKTWFVTERSVASSCRAFRSHIHEFSELLSIFPG